LFDHQFFLKAFPDLYNKFVEWAKIAAPVVQVKLTDGRQFWVNRVITSEEVPQAATFFQEVTKDSRVAFVVPYEQIAYIALNSHIPPEYLQIPEPKRPPIGFRIERDD
jgi:hypothetical protein